MGVDPKELFEKLIKDMSSHNTRSFPESFVENFCIKNNSKRGREGLEIMNTLERVCDSVLNKQEINKSDLKVYENFIKYIENIH